MIDLRYILLKYTLLCNDVRRAFASRIPNLLPTPRTTSRFHGRFVVISNNHVQSF